MILRVQALWEEGSGENALEDETEAGAVVSLLWGWMLPDLSTRQSAWEGTVPMGDGWCLSHPSTWEMCKLRLSLASLFMNQNSRTAWSSWGEQGLEGEGAEEAG